MKTEKDLQGNVCLVFRKIIKLDMRPYRYSLERAKMEYVTIKWR